jgi:hypothetical protein
MTSQKADQQTAQFCNAQSPTIKLGNPMVVGSIRETYIACDLAKGHTGNHRGTLHGLIGRSPELWEWQA